MRYFDYILSEALATTPSSLDKSKTKSIKMKDKPGGKKRKGELHGQALYDEIKRLINKIGEENLSPLEVDRYWDALDTLKTDDNTEDFKRCFDKIARDNRDNKIFAKALERRAYKGDNLVLWMFRYLAGKAGSGS